MVVVDNFSVDVVEALVLGRVLLDDLGKELQCFEQSQCVLICRYCLSFKLVYKRSSPEDCLSEEICLSDLLVFFSFLVFQVLQHLLFAVWIVLLAT